MEKGNETRREDRRRRVGEEEQRRNKRRGAKKRTRDREGQKKFVTVGRKTKKRNT